MTDEEWQMCQDCSCRHSKMSPWEENFINELMTRGEEYKLSPKQGEKLETIWEKVT